MAGIGLKLVNSLRRFMVALKCPKCGHQFKPGAGPEFASMAEVFSNPKCPKCGHVFNIDENNRGRAANPPGPFRQPKNSKITTRAMSEREQEFDIPSGGHWGGLLPITILWNLFIPPAFFHFVVLGKWPVLVPQIFFTVFFLAGMGLLWGAFAVRFTSYRLFLGPETIRLERAFLWKRNQRVPTREIDQVRRTTAYENVSEGNDEMQKRDTRYLVNVHAGLRGFQFGASLSPADQHWLAWTIREHVRRCGGTKLPEELSTHQNPIEPRNE